jgi:hypothetical protein
MYKYLIVFAVTTVALFAFAAAVGGDEQPGAAEEWSALPDLELQQWGDPSTDRESCEMDCRMRYSGGGGGSSGGAPRFRVLAACIAECERQFWKRFDERTEDLK